MNYVGRFAPSPTGPLHQGSLLAALASYVDARAQGGQWLIRIEDVDRARCSREHELSILQQLREYGFVHDGEIVRQSDRSNHYDSALMTLTLKGLTYRCRCTRSMLANEPRNADGEVIYPGRCRGLALGPGSSVATSIRLNVQRVSGAKIVRYVDRAAGEGRQDVVSEVGDFILHRADGDYAYQLAVVVDDALQGVTHVVRGADLLSNTARQVVLQQALEYGTPSYLHVPLVVNNRGEKLSKQTKAAPLPNAPGAKLQALKEAWAGLHQADLGVHDTPQSFLLAAVTYWQPQRLCTLENRYNAPNL